MEYKDLVSDFAKRTAINLDHVKRHELAGDEEAYYVTQLWNLLAGLKLIVSPKEVELDRIRPIPMIELIAEGWPDITTSDWRPDTLPEFAVALRNAVSHWNVTFKAKPSHEIYELMHSTVNRRNQWRGRMSVGFSRTWRGGSLRNLSGILLQPRSRLPPDGHRKVRSGRRQRPRAAIALFNSDRHEDRTGVWGQVPVEFANLCLRSSGTLCSRYGGAQ